MVSSVLSFTWSCPVDLILEESLPACSKEVGEKRSKIVPRTHLLERQRFDVIQVTFTESQYGLDSETRTMKSEHQLALEFFVSSWFLFQSIIVRIGPWKLCFRPTTGWLN